MRRSWRTVLAAVVGGIVSAVVTAYATTRVLPLQEHLYTVTNVAATAAVAFGGGIVGVVLGWLVNGRSARGMGAVAAVVSVAGSVVGTFWWARVAGAQDESGLFLVGAILLLGISLVGLVAVCGITVAMLAIASRETDEPRGSQL